MATQQADIDALNQQIADGVRQVTIQGETTVMNPTDSLIRARDDQQRQLNEVSLRNVGRRLAKRTLLFFGGRGYD